MRRFLDTQFLGETMFPSRMNPTRHNLERMLLFFVDRNKAHAHPSNLDMLDSHLDYAHNLGLPYDWVQLHSGSLFGHAEVPEFSDADVHIDTQTNEFIDQAIVRCKAKGCKVSYMMGEFSSMEAFLDAYPKIRNLQSGLFWKLVYDTSVSLFNRFPDLDELGLYFFESKDIIHYTNYFKQFQQSEGDNPMGVDDGMTPWPYMSLPDILRHILIQIAKACKDCNKSFSLLTHVWFPYQEELLLETLRDFPSDLPLLLEHNYTTGDFNPCFPFPKLIRELSYKNHGICYCCGMEYHGLGLIPCCFPEILIANVAQAMEDTPNLKRITVRPIWDGHSLLGTPNEVNLFMVLHATMGILVDTEQLWKLWIRKRYGLTSKEYDLAVILRSSYKVVRSVNFLFGIRTNDHSHLPSFSVLQSRFFNYAKAMYQWTDDPDLRLLLFEIVTNTETKHIRLIEEIYDQAQKIVQCCLVDIEALKEEMREDDFLDIKNRFFVMKEYVELHQMQYDSFFRLLVLRKQADDEIEEKLLKNLMKLEQWSVQKQSSTGSCYLIDPRTITDFVDGCRGMLAIIHDVNKGVE